MKSNPYYVIEFEKIIFTCRLKAWLFMLIISIINQIATRYPEKAKKIIKGAMYKEVESVMSNAEFEEHFSPPYNVRKLQGPTKSYCQSVYIFPIILN